MPFFQRIIIRKQQGLFYRNAYYITRITRNSTCEDIEKEIQRLLSKICDWLEPYATTLIELPGIAQESRTNAFDEKMTQIKCIVNQMAERYDCVAIRYEHSFEQKNQIDIIKEMKLKVPYMRWKSNCDSKTKTLSEQLQEDEIDYQKRLFAWIDQKEFEKELMQNKRKKL